jgi:hypothetical protein
VAFVSNDRAFAREDEERDTNAKALSKGREASIRPLDPDKDHPLHQDLERDVSAYGVTISFFSHLSSFIKRNTLTSSPITVEWLRELGGLDKVRAAIEQKITALLVEGQGYAERILSVSVNGLDFDRGTVYDINESTRFAEISFNTTLGLVLEREPSNTVALSTLLGPEATPAAKRAASARAMLGLSGRSWPADASTFQGNELWTLGGQLIRHTTLSALIKVSTRLQSGNIGDLEVDDFRFDPSNDDLFSMIESFTWPGTWSAIS